MIALVSAAYVAAAALLGLAVSIRRDPVVASRLSPPASRPSHRVLRGVGRWIPRANSARARVAARLAAAGEDGGRVDEVMAGKVVCAALLVTCALVSAPVVGGGLVLLMPALAAGGWLLPEVSLERRARRRRSTAAGQVSDALDMVAVAVTAGLSPRLALERAVEETGPPLRDDLAGIGRTVAVGGSWLDALADAARRSGLRDLDRLSATLRTAHRTGVPMSERLRALARDVRQARRAAAQERAGRAPVVMLFPLVFLILPAFVLAAVAPAVIVATRGGL